MLKKVVSLLCALALLLTCSAALAENTKHERVYIVASPDGAVKSLTDNIRLENADHADEITDRTLLTAIENVSGDETFTLDGETLVWKANGRDITYQGTSDKTPALLPVMTLTLDGAEISAADLKEKAGDVTLTVTYQAAESLPALAVTAMLLPEKGVSDLKLENAAVLTVMGRQVLVGWAVPGTDASLNLPASFSASFRADHADLGWAMTLTTSDPIDAACKELDAQIGSDIITEINEITALLTALKDGSDLPETTGITKDIIPKIKQLNAGLTTLDSGAATLAESAKSLSDGAASVNTGTAQLKEGAASLDAGLAALTENSEALNAGASQLFDSILAAANDQLASAGLDALGVTLPPLTRENYAEVLDGLIAKIPAALKPAADQLTALKSQLDQVNTFVAGLQTYTDGVATASEGAKTLSEGADTLATGASQLSGGAMALYIGAGALQTTGTQTLKDSILGAEKEAAEKLLPILQDQVAKFLRVYDETRANVRNAGYDLRPEAMKTVTVCIIRTDLQ
jgi:putative membrane protein